MTYQNLIGQYDSLRNKLEMAYACKHWDSQQIDQIADEIIKTELALARSSRLPLIGLSEPATGAAA